jgi:YfiH family protein
VREVEARARTVVEAAPRVDAVAPLWTQPEWSERFAWLVQGTTGAGSADEPFDLGLFGSQPVGSVMARWRALREATAMPVALHARQVHRGKVAWHTTRPESPGLLVTEGVDGHATDAPGLLLTVSVADCVPVSIVDETRRTVALLHAGWRGVAAGIVEHGIERLRAAGSRTEALWLHCGPAICGRCYEVGPEVHRAVHPDRPAPAAPTPIDLRAAIAERAAEAGIEPSQITLSAHCTRCGPGAFFSHRAGSPARQMGVLGVRA